MTNLNNGDDLQPEPPASLPVGLPLSFPFFQLIEYCRECNNWEEANQIFAMINRLMRFRASQQDYDLLDSVEKILKQRSHGHVFHNSKITMEQPCINGPMYEIKNNEHINLGGNGINEK